MADSTTSTHSTKDENARLRALLEQNGIDPDQKVDEHAGIVGNLADLQRWGKAQVASEGKAPAADAVTVPPVNVEGEHLAPSETVSGKPVSDLY